MEEAFLLVQPTAKEAPPKMLIKSGIDAVVWFNCPLKECQRRADGRRIDCNEVGKSEQTFYHVDDQKPPSDNAPLCENLELIDEDWNHTSSLVDRAVSYDMQQNSLKRWLQAFGVEERNYNLLQEINANESKDMVFDQISQVINQVLDNKQTERESIREMFVIKLRKIKEEKDRLAAMDIVSDNIEKSVEEGDVKTQGELSKSISDKKDLNDGNTGRKSKNPDSVSPNAQLNDQSTLDVPAGQDLSKIDSHRSLNQLP